MRNYAFSGRRGKGLVIDPKVVLALAGRELKTPWIVLPGKHTLESSNQEM